MNVKITKKTANSFGDPETIPDLKNEYLKI